jgi:hypothetical protein
VRSTAGGGRLGPYVEYFAAKNASAEERERARAAAQRAADALNKSSPAVGQFSVRLNDEDYAAAQPRLLGVWF